MAPALIIEAFPTEDRKAPSEAISPLAVGTINDESIVEYT
jgi:hypothetical protein